MLVKLLTESNITVGRTKRLRADLMEKFKAYATARGFSRESILTPPPAGKLYTYTAEKLRNISIIMLEY